MPVSPSRVNALFRFLSLCLFVSLLQSPAGSAFADSPGETRENDFAARIEQVLARPDLNRTVFGVRVIELPGGRELFARNPHKALIPASNMKLVTTAAALAILGDEYRFRTVLGFQGPDLVVVGGGDPTFDAEFGDGDATAVLRQWARALRASGVRRIKGDLLLDDSLFDRQYVHPAWPNRQLHRSYCAPVGALSLNDNCVDATLTAGDRPGGKAGIELSPAGNTMERSGHVTTIADRKNHVWYAYRNPESRTITFGGRFWSKAGPATTAVTVDDPTRFFGGVFAAVLRDEGISLAGEIRRVAGIDPGQLARRLEHRTPILPVLEHVNKESQNFYAEQLFKTTGAYCGGTGSWTTGRQAVLHFLDVVGLSGEGIYVDDGSGLSRGNRLTAWHLTELLRVMDQSPYRQVFRGSLAVAGVDGTLSHRLRDDDCLGRVQAKTGTLAGVRALTGYVEARGGREFVVSLLANNTCGRVVDAQNDICRILIDAGSTGIRD